MDDLVKQFVERARQELGMDDEASLLENPLVRPMIRDASKIFTSLNMEISKEQGKRKLNGETLLTPKEWDQMIAEGKERIFRELNNKIEQLSETGRI